MTIGPAPESQDPVLRFTELCAAIVPRRTWFRSHRIKRLACLGLLSIEGDPHSLAQSFRHTCSELRQGAGWFGQLSGSLRYGVAAALVRRGQSAGSFAVELKRVRAWMREERLPRGEMHETVATLLLSGSQPDLQTRREQVERVAYLHRAMSRRRRFLTGIDDLPCCVLLCRDEGDPGTIVNSVEDYYSSLRDLGFSRGNPLQTTSHILHLCPGEAVEVLQRFEELFSSFRSRGLRMRAANYVQTSTLCLVQSPVDQIVDTVSDHGARILGATDARGRNEGFQLAVGTALFTLAQGQEETTRTGAASHLMSLVDILHAQQMAMIAGAAAVAATS